MSIPPQPGDEIFEGRVFRRIQNLKSRFKNGRALVGVFRSAPGDVGELSCHLEALACEEDLRVAMANNPIWKPFGLCALDVARIKSETSGRVMVIFKPDETDPALGHAHVVLTNCHDQANQTALMRIAETIKAPDEPLK